MSSPIIPQSQLCTEAPTEVLTPIVLHNDGLIGTQDDWKGKSDPKARKKIQNRLNQRLRRRRLRAQGQQPQTDIHSSHVPVQDFRTDSKPNSYSSHSTTREFIHPGPLSTSIVSDPSWQLVSTQARQGRSVADLEYAAHSHYFGSPKADFLLTLIQFNVFRALLRNSVTLKLGFDWLQDAATSCIGKQAYDRTTTPPGLQPTALQLQSTHHPWTDLFPFPQFRDNILKACDGNEDLEDRLCAAMIGWCNSPGTRTGIIVWGESWDPWGWEVTEGFCQKWGWLLVGCEDLVASSNRWRSVRQERPLDLRYHRVPVEEV